MPQPEKSRAAAFPSGDLPAVMPDCNGAGQLFSAAAQRGAALHREAK
jgi:hypothetical protein